MKIKHNKKRNTAFVYEALVREVTVAVMKNDDTTKEKAVSLIKKHFKPTSILRRELECYRSLYETKNVNQIVFEKILNEARRAHGAIDADGIFEKQSELIDDVNKELSPKVFNNFVPNYKTLATIYQMFSSGNTPKNTVILESQLIKQVCVEERKQDNSAVDNLVVTSFVEKFNDKYAENLTEHQRQLLNLYILSFTDNSLSLKSFLNEEIRRLKKFIVENYDTKEFVEDVDMKNKAIKIVEKLDTYNNKSVDDSVLATILKTQALVEELSKDGSND